MGCGLDFTVWTTQWESYISLSRLFKESDKRKVQTFTLHFTYETLSIVHNLGLSDAEMKDVWPHKESTKHKYFHRCTQQPRKCFEDFLLALYGLVKTYSNECTQENIHVTNLLKAF